MKTLVAVLPFVLLGAAGCSGPPSRSMQAKADLGSIAMQYHWYVDAHKQPPNNADQLATFENPHNALSGNQKSASQSATALETGDYVVIWSYDVADDLARNGKVILAYHKDVPGEGGYVAFADGATRLLTKEQFTATPKAQPMADSDVTDAPPGNTDP